MDSTLEDLKFDPGTGLIPVVVQDARSARVLMVGYMNREAVSRTRDTGALTFFSRSRQELWTKGDTSGHWLELVELRPDCDNDTLLARAYPHGPTCHTGEPSCFGDPRRPTLGEILGDLYTLIEQRNLERPDGSYTTQLFDAGPTRISQKLAEEAVELALEAAGARERVDEEAADLLYHLLVLLAGSGVTPEGVAARLAERRGGPK